MSDATGVSVRDATDADRAAIIALLRSAELPIDGIDDAAFIVAELDGTMVGCAALERRGNAALLRSVAVATHSRNRGVGRALVTRLLDAASKTEIERVVLLTTTADDWFVRYGFSRITRDAVPTPLLASVEFQGVCPASAAIMQRTGARTASN